MKTQQPTPSQQAYLLLREVVAKDQAAVAELKAIDPRYNPPTAMLDLHARIEACLTTENQDTGDQIKPWAGKLHHAIGAGNDWGFVRDESNKLIFRVNVSIPESECEKHRLHGTDPTQPIVDALLAAVNGDQCYLANLLVMAYREKRKWDGLNGRTWSASKHFDAESRIEELELPLNYGNY